jgi:hypothetical protein
MLKPSLVCTRRIDSPTPVGTAKTVAASTLDILGKVLLTVTFVKFVAFVVFATTVLAGGTTELLLIVTFGAGGAAAAGVTGGVAGGGAGTGTELLA